MKIIGFHHFNQFKFYTKTIGKYALMSTMVLGGAAFASGQSFDMTTFSGMDFYSRPNNVSTRAYGDGDVNSDGIVNSKDIDAIKSGVLNDYADVNGDNIQGDSADISILQKYINGEIKHLPGDWNNLNGSEKIFWLDKRATHYAKTWGSLPAVDGVNPDCGNYTLQFDLQFEGMDNFSNFIGYDYNYDGKKEGYDYYKNEVQNGKENLPMYFIGVTEKNGVGHFWPGVFVGSENPNEKDNPLDLNQWYVFDYATGKRVKPGDFGMDENSPVTINWWGWAMDGFGNWSHQPVTLVQFDLKDGVASLVPNGTNSYILKENPHHATINLGSIEDKFFTKEEDIAFENPTVETNVVNYSPTLEREFSDTIVYDFQHYSFTVTDIGKLKIGRWNGTPGNNYFLENLVDSSSYRVDVDLTSGVNEAKSQGGFDIEPRYSAQGVNLKTFATENGKVSLEVFDITGQLVRQKQFDASQGTSRDWRINSSLNPGTYIYRGTLKTNDGNVSVDSGKLEIK